MTRWLLPVAVIAATLVVPVSAVAATPPAPPTNLIDLATRSYPAIHTLHWNPSADSARVAYYRVYRDDFFVAQASGTSYQIDNSTALAGSYTVRAFDPASGESIDSKAVKVVPGFLLAVNGASWNTCVTPGAPTPPGPYDGCFASGTSVYALRKFNVKYSATSARLGQSFITVYYRQKFTPLPAGYPGYDVNVIVGAGTTWSYVTTLRLPAAGPDVPQSATTSVTVPIDHPGELELQWVNDGAYGGGDSNLQLDRVEVGRG